MHYKFRLFFLVMILALVATQVMANNDVLAPDDGCPETMQYLPAGMDVHYAPRINPGVVSNGYVDPVVITNLHTYYMALLQAELPTSSLLTPLPDLDEIGEAPTPIQLTGNYYCVNDGITGVFREVQSNGQVQWIIEAIFIDELVLTDDIIENFTTELLEPLEMSPEDNPQIQYLPSAFIGDIQSPDEPAPLADVQAPDTTPVLSNAAFYFWEIYDITPYDGPGGVQAPDPLPQNYCGDYTALSYLGVGQQARMSGYQYARFSLEGDLADNNRDNWLNLGDPVFNSQYAIEFHYAMMATSIYQQPVSFDFVPPVVATAETIFAAPMLDVPIANILAGPFCGSYEIVDNTPCPENGACEYTPPEYVIRDRYAIWWQIEVTVHGETYLGWYPENLTQYAWWLYENEGIFDQVATSYLLTPIGEAMTVSGDDCDTLPGSRFAAGTDIQPANGAMNIRDSANGDVIGRIEADSVMTLVGEPECENGIRWREVIFHEGSIERGWIAENDDSVFYITTYVPPVETVEPEPTREPDHSGDDNTAQTTREPDSTGGSSTRPTPTPGLVIPVVPATAQATDSSCDPATGAGC